MESLAQTILQANAEQELIERAVEFADFCEKHRQWHRHITEVKLIDAVKQYRTSMSGKMSVKSID